MVMWRRIYGFIAELFGQMGRDQVPLLAAGLSFYTLISLAPLLVVAIAIAGLLFGQQAAQGQVVAEIQNLVGQEGAEAVASMIRRTSRPSASVPAALIGLGVLAFGASRVFWALQATMNTIWGVEPAPVRGGFIGALLKQRVFSFMLVLGTGFLLLVSLLVSAALAGLTKYFSGLLPGIDWLWQLANLFTQFILTALIFGAIFKVVPDVRVRWRTVALGAVFTAALFSLGRFLLGMYLGRGSFASVYGAAGSLVIILFWAYWSAQILCLGAEFTQLYARRRGDPIRPAAGARLAEHCPPAGQAPAKADSGTRVTGRHKMARKETIYDTLKQDHREVKELFEKLCNTGEGETKRRAELFNKLKQELKGHSEAEAEVVYEPLEHHKESRMKTLEGEEEHHLVDILLAELEQDDKGSDRWLAKLQVLKETVEHHVQEEEKELFDKAHDIFSDEEAQDLAQRFQSVKEQRIIQMQGGNFPG